MRKIFKRNQIFLAVGLGLAAFSILLVREIREAPRVRASNITNICPGDSSCLGSTDHWAWNDIVGWIDFYNPPGDPGVLVQSKRVVGWASSSVGDLSLNCENTGNSSGNDFCSQSNYKVYNNGAGYLSGWAWNDVVGWISFCGDPNSISTDKCPQVAQKYQVVLLPSGTDANGNDLPPSTFNGWAWNDAVGWISFNCLDPGFCGTSDYKVKTGWYATSTYGDVYSSIFDTGVTGGAQFNSITVIGDIPSGTNFLFQLATTCTNSGSSPPSCSSNDWKFIGPDGTTNTFYQGSGVGSCSTCYVKLDYQVHNNARYFRYRVRLKSDKTQNITPRVDDVIVNWSP
ncbi:MAG: hypothetical protein HY093_03535 [Candidatus Liptonbacteria bacterium]|nr:hypothetical protein [Candidatus Liptonbacteria bacterium]